MQEIKIIIGLGNPGKEYEKTYHNAGRIFVEYWNEHQKEIASQSLAMTGGETEKGGNRGVEALATDGFMNQSGDSVRKILKERGLRIEDALIVHDDSDIYMGDYKISRDRGAAGHKGVEHIMAVFGTKDFTRLRIGIRPKQKTGTERKKADEFVLKKITAANMKVLEKVFEEATSRLSS